MSENTNPVIDEIRPKKDVRVCIIGAGMGGMSTAIALSRAGFQDIHIYESASNLGFVGAGIQLAPNMARILDRFGIWAEVAKDAVKLEETSIRQGSTDSELGLVSLVHVEKLYEYPHMVAHRASLADALCNGCKRAPGIKFFFGSSVEKVDFTHPSKPRFTVRVKDENSTYPVDADLLIGADGIKSRTRVSMQAAGGVSEEILDTDQAAYRIMLTRQQMQDNPELLELIDSDRATRWIGERRHIIAYPVANKTMYNISSVQPDFNFAEAPSTTYTTKGFKAAMLSVFADFCPRVQDMLNLVPDGEVCEWKLRVHTPLATWVHGSCALVGDSCHPTLPHLAQGAAQAIEDAATLEAVFSVLERVTSDNINRALKLYERLRRDRAYKLVDIAAASGRALHLPKGSAQEERDQQFAALKDGQGSSPDKWADAELQKYIYADCIPEAQKLAHETFAVI